eukprot:Rhum_TRINITY_DN12867_c1_g1::Rhum_TRINITY_DN12867_c1_g1_i1::g.54840::m.54840
MKPSVRPPLLRLLPYLFFLLSLLLVCWVCVISFFFFFLLSPGFFLLVFYPSLSSSHTITPPFVGWKGGTSGGEAAGSNTLDRFRTRVFVGGVVAFPDQRACDALRGDSGAAASSPAFLPPDSVGDGVPLLACGECGESGLPKCTRTAPVRGDFGAEPDRGCCCCCCCGVGCCPKEEVRRSTGVYGEYSCCSSRWPYDATPGVDGGFDDRRMTGGGASGPSASGDVLPCDEPPPERGDSPYPPWCWCCVVVELGEHSPEPHSEYDPPLPPAPTMYTSRSFCGFRAAATQRADFSGHSACPAMGPICTSPTDGVVGVRGACCCCCCCC